MHEGIFIFKDYSVDKSNGLLLFSYEQITSSGEMHRFTETLSINEKAALDKLPDQLLQGLHLILGISYYKLYCSKKISIENYSLSEDQANFWNTVYTKGLGELFYVNKIDPRGLISFPFDDGSEVSNVDDDQKSDRALVLIGGGKDSVVSIETIKKAQVNFDLFSLNSYEVVENVASVAGKEVNNINREIDPLLIELNEREDTFNGHVPISGIYAFTSLLFAYLNDYAYIVLSNERSSNYGNTTYCDMEISHQWSKSKEFEDMFRSYVNKYISRNIEYFSLLRPIYEIKIAEIFSRYPEYFKVFSSSNHNFRIDSKPESRWDYTSAKTLFVFILLSAFLSKNDMLRIFGKNLYEEEQLLPLMRELLGLTGIKPLDCVGTPDETRVAMYMAQTGEYDDTIGMKMFNEEVLPEIKNNIGELQKNVFSYENDDNIPSQFVTALKEVLNEN